jgi:hypothetical protein
MRRDRQGRGLRWRVRETSRGVILGLGAAVVAALVAGATVGCGQQEQLPPDAQPAGEPIEAGDCLGRGSHLAGGYSPRGCDHAEATHEILAMVTDLGRADRPLCPAGTDELLPAEQGPVVDGDIASLPQTWCLRNLEPPHPGDPGMGGGELVEQDCIVDAAGAIDEVPCDGRGPAPPQHRLVGVVDVAEACPPGTAEPIGLDVTPPQVLCAAPV